MRIRYEDNIWVAKLKYTSILSLYIDFQNIGEALVLLREHLALNIFFFLTSLKGFGFLDLDPYVDPVSDPA
jgi:hypothetical protein